MMTRIENNPSLDPRRKPYSPVQRPGEVSPGLTIDVPLRLTLEGVVRFVAAEAWFVLVMGMRGGEPVTLDMVDSDMVEKLIPSRREAISLVRRHVRRYGFSTPPPNYLCDHIQRRLEALWGVA